MIARLIADGLKAGSLLPRIDLRFCMGGVLLVAGVYLISRDKE